MKNIIFLQLIAFSLLICLINGEIVNTRSCTGGSREQNPKSEVHSVSITPCSQAPDGPCEMSTSQSATLSIDFTPTIKMQRNTRQGFYSTLGSVGVQLAGLPKYACRNTNCRLAANVRRTYQVQIPMRSSFPKNTYAVKIKLYQGATVIVCRVFDVKIV